VLVPSRAYGEWPGYRGGAGVSPAVSTWQVFTTCQINSPVTRLLAVRDRFRSVVRMTRRLAWIRSPVVGQQSGVRRVGNVRRDACGRKIRRHRIEVLRVENPAAIGEIGGTQACLSNALIEFADTKIRLLTRGVFGFKPPSAENVPTFGDAPPPTLLPDGDSRRLHPHQMLLVDLAVDQPSTGRQVKARFRE